MLRSLVGSEMCIRDRDNLEGYNPENHGNSAYNREMRDIELENRESEKAWILSLIHI